MVIWGNRVFVQKVETLMQECAHCKHLKLGVYFSRKVFTLFWVPCFPYDSFYTAACENCGTEYELSSISNELADNKPRPSIVQFIGLVLFPALITFLVLLEDRHTKEVLEQTKVYRASPQVKDIIVYKVKEEADFPYTFLKITEVNANSLTVIYSKTVFEKPGDARTTAKKSSDRSFVPEEYSLPMKLYIEMNIQEIIRKK